MTRYIVKYRVATLHQIYDTHRAEYVRGRFANLSRALRRAAELEAVCLNNLTRK